MVATFKKQLGENVIGLKLSVGQVLKLVQQKANKDDVLSLLNKRCVVKEKDLHYKVNILHKISLRGAATHKAFPFSCE